MIKASVFLAIILLAVLGIIFCYRFIESDAEKYKIHLFAEEGSKIHARYREEQDGLVREKRFTPEVEKEWRIRYFTELVDLYRRHKIDEVDQVYTKKLSELKGKK